MNGKLIKHDIPSIEEYWKEDSVAFLSRYHFPRHDITRPDTDQLVGCSFTFEQALADAGLVPRHQEVERNVPMYRTSLPLLPSGSECPSSSDYRLAVGLHLTPSSLQGQHGGVDAAVQA